MGEQQAEQRVIRAAGVVWLISRWSLGGAAADQRTINGRSAGGATGRAGGRSAGDQSSGRHVDISRWSSGRSSGWSVGDHSSGCLVGYQRVEQWVISGRSEQRASWWDIGGWSSGSTAGGAVGDQWVIIVAGVVWDISGWSSGWSAGDQSGGRCVVDQQVIIGWSSGWSSDHQWAISRRRSGRSRGQISRRSEQRASCGISAGGAAGGAVGDQQAIIVAGVVWLISRWSSGGAAADHRTINGRSAGGGSGRSRGRSAGDQSNGCHVGYQQVEQREEQWVIRAAGVMWDISGWSAVSCGNQQVEQRVISGVVWDISGISAVSCGISVGGAAGDQRVSCGRSSASLMLLLCGIAPPHHLNITDRRRPLTASLFLWLKQVSPRPVFVQPALTQLSVACHSLGSVRFRAPEDASALHQLNPALQMTCWSLLARSLVTAFSFMMKYFNETDGDLLNKQLMSNYFRKVYFSAS